MGFISENKQKLSVAFLVSAIGVGLSFGWLEYANKDLEAQGQRTPIATLIKSTNEVQKKTKEGVIWNTIDTNDTLYVGESVRTGKNSSAEIEFLNTKASISIDPDSVISLEMAEGKPTLDFISGNLLVKADDKGGEQALKIKSGEKTLSVSDSSLALTKSEQGKLNVDVLAGQIDKLEGAQESDLVTQSSIKVTAPQPAENIYFSPDDNAVVTIEWNKIPDHKIFIEAGSSKNKLAQLRGHEAGSDQGFLKVPVGNGKIFFRLKAVSTKDSSKVLNSSVYNFNVFKAENISLFEPKTQEQIPIRDNAEIAFRWNGQSIFDKSNLEMSSDSTFTDIVKTIDVSGKSSIRVSSMGLPFSKNIFWRVKSTMNNGQKTVISSIQSFQLKQIFNLLAPNLLSPLSSETIAVQRFKDEGLTLAWQKDPYAKSYVVEIEENGLVTKKIDADNSLITVNDLKPGNYQWHVFSVDSDGKFSPSSEKRSFAIADLPSVEWIGLNNEFQYFSQKPSLSLEWGQSSLAKAWKVRISDSQKKPIKDWIVVYSNKMTEDLPSDGIYTIELEGLNEARQTVVKAKTKTLLVKASLALPPPRFSPETPANLLADAKGNIMFDVEPIEGAKNYQVQIRNLKGAELSVLNLNNTKANVESLKPGQYLVSVRSIDQNGRAGQWGQARPISVTMTTNLTAPKIKKVIVDEE